MTCLQDMLEIQQLRAQLLFFGASDVTMATVFDLPPEVSSEDLTAAWYPSVSILNTLPCLKQLEPWLPLIFVDAWNLQSYTVFPLQVLSRNSLAGIIVSDQRSFVTYLKNHRFFPNSATSEMARKWCQLYVDVILSIGYVTLTSHVSCTMVFVLRSH